ncbi:MAG: VWA domain-containing protein, partial [Evtepia sp.]|nr:VWA domain-containing protein [Evtepia sp.]
MKKKFLALVLTLAMVLSLVPATALATGATQPNIQNPEPCEDGYVKLEKRAAAVPGRDNTFDITLKATVTDGKEEGAKTSTDAVLVIDRSGSMKSEENGDRITPAQDAAKDFANVVLGESANPQNRIAVVSYADEAERNIDLSSDLDAVRDAINNFSALGGTNIQAGIKAARDILKSSNANNKVILVLSDGEPTYSFRAVGIATQTGCDIGSFLGIPWHTDGHIDSSSVEITGFDYNSIAGSGGDYQYDYTWNSRRDSAKLQVTCEHNKTKSERYPFYENNGQPTIQEASYAKEAGYEIYSIYLGKDTDTNAVSTMKGIATDNNHYKLATDASELGRLFKGIAADITIPVIPGMVTDPMGDHMNLVANSLQNNSAVTINDGGFTWNLTQVTPTSNTNGSRTYELTYQITFDTDFEGFNATEFYPTNKETTLAYTVQGQEKTAIFPIPEVKGKAKVKVTYEVTGDTKPAEDTISNMPSDEEVYKGSNVNAGSNPTTSSTTNGNAQGTWEFSGWTTTDETKNVQNDVHYTGYWTFKETAKVKVTYEVTGDTKPAQDT